MTDTSTTDESKSDMTKRLAAQGFDPAEDDPRTSTRLQIKRVYNALKAEGFDVEARELREAGGSSQRELAHSLARDVLETHASLV